MKAGVWTALGSVECLDWPEPSVKDDEVLVRVAYCGFCGSDASIIDGHMVSGKPPRILGHEVSGTVVALGREASGIDLDTSVACNMWRYCGRCTNCQAGRASGCANRRICASGFAEYAVYSPEQLHPLPKDVSLEQAILVDPLATCMRGAELATLQAGEDVLIIGGGALGLLMVQAAALWGARRVVMCSSVPSRRELAMLMGATGAVDPSTLAKESAGSHTSPEAAFDVVFEAAGVAARLRYAVGVLNHGGRLVVLGGYDGQTRVPLSPDFVQRRELQIIGSVGSTYAFGRALQALPRLVTEPLLSTVEPLADIAKVYANHRDGRYVRALVDPRPQGRSG